MFSAAGHITGLHPGTAVATASACGWAGFVCGPPLIGQIASLTSLTSLPAALGRLPLLPLHRRRHVARTRSQDPTATPRSTGRRGLHVVIEWLLVDYGEVISVPLPDDTSNELATLAGQNPAEFLQRYWQARPAYDLGQAPATYGSRRSLAAI